MKSTCDALSPPETVSCGLLILARIIAREAVSQRLAKCVTVSHAGQLQTDFRIEQPTERVAEM